MFSKKEIFFQELSKYSTKEYLDSDQELITNEWVILMKKKGEENCICKHLIKHYAYVYNLRTGHILTIGVGCCKKYGLNQTVNNMFLIEFFSTDAGSLILKNGFFDINCDIDFIKFLDMNILNVCKSNKENLEFYTRIIEVLKENLEELNTIYNFYFVKKYFQKINENLKKEILKNENLENENENLENENLGKENLEKENLENENLEKEKENLEKEKENLEKEKENLEKEKENLEKEKENLEKENLEKENLEKENLGKENLEKEILKKENLEKEILEKEILEKEILEKEKENLKKENESLKKENENLKNENENLKNENENLKNENEILKIVPTELYTEVPTELYTEVPTELHNDNMLALNEKNYNIDSTIRRLKNIKNGFKEVREDMEKFNNKIREHRQKIELFII
jgi:uncharacterized protein YjbI with pentapeptide repeats